MPLDADRKTRLLQFIQERGKAGGQCPLCTRREWQLGDEVWALAPFVEGAINFGSVVLPVVSLICMHCGNTFFINAVVAGISEPVSQKQASPPSDEAAQPNKEEANNASN